MKKIRPQRLKKGDTIGIITPSGVIKKKQLETIVEKFKLFGYKTYYKPSVLSEYGYLAGSDVERAEELMHMFENRKINAVLCARGGYGASRILHLLDYSIIKNNPKVFIGYSDITALITAFYQKTGLVSFHGPIGNSSFNEYTKKSFEDVICNPKNQHKYAYERENETQDNREFDFYTITSGKSKGELIGGNLSVIISLIGTEYEADFEKKIVYLEEIDENTYKVDRMLTQLIQATNFRKASGIIFGAFKGCNKNKSPTFSLKEMIAETIRSLEIPAVYGFPFGHTGNIMTIPTGIEAELEADKKALMLIERAVD